MACALYIPCIYPRRLPSLGLLNDGDWTIPEQRLMMAAGGSVALHRFLALTQNSAMEAKPQRRKWHEDAPSSLNAAIDALGPAMDEVNAKPVKDVLHTTGVLITTIRVRFPPAVHGADR